LLMHEQLVDLLTDYESLLRYVLEMS